MLALFAFYSNVAPEGFRLDDEKSWKGEERVDPVRGTSPRTLAVGFYSMLNLQEFPHHINMIVLIFNSSASQRGSSALSLVKKLELLNVFIYHLSCGVVVYFL